MKTGIFKYNYLKLLFFSAVVTALTPATSFSSQNTRLSADFQSSWRKTDSVDLFDGFRANSSHYWNWLKSHSSSPLFSVRGVVTGDPHILNFGDVPLETTGRELALIDVDDSGVDIPFAADFLRFLIGNQVSGFKVEAYDLLQAYYSGIAGNKMLTPKYLADIFKKSDADFNSRQKKYINKLSTPKGFNFKSGLKPINEAPQEIKELFTLANKVFAGFMADFKILDVGYKIKKDGGSQGLPRFWFLLEKNDKKHIWEFKLAAKPGTSFFSTQPEARLRLKAVADIYRPSRKAQGPYEYINAGASTFLLRERFTNYLDLDPSEISNNKDLNAGKQMSLYIANKMGQWHRRQIDPATFILILKDKNTFPEIHRLMENYISIMRQENSINQRP